MKRFLHGILGKPRKTTENHGTFTIKRLTANLHEFPRIFFGSLTLLSLALLSSQSIASSLTNIVEEERVTLMADPIKISFVFNDKNYHGAYAAHLWVTRKPWIIIRSILCVAMVIFGGFLMIQASNGQGGRMADVFAYMFVAAGSVGLLRPMIWQMWHERGIRKHPTYGSKIKYSFSDDGIQVDGKKGKYDISWSDVLAIKSSKRGELIYVGKNKYLWLPLEHVTPALHDLLRKR